MWRENLSAYAMVGLITVRLGWQKLLESLIAVAPPGERVEPSRKPTGVAPMSVVEPEPEPESEKPIRTRMQRIMDGDEES